MCDFDEFGFAGEYDKAIAQYDKLLAENPGNILAMKRKVMVAIYCYCIFC